MIYNAGPLKLIQTFDSPSPPKFYVAHFKWKVRHLTINPVTNAFLCVKFLHSKRKQRILSILPLNWHARAGRYSEGRVGPDEELSLNLGGIIDKKS